MHLSVFIIGQRIGLQAAFDKFVCDDDVVAGCFDHQIKNVQQLSGIAPTISQKRPTLFQFNMLFLQFYIRGDCPIDEPEQIILFKGFQHIKLATGKQWPNNLKRRIFGRCSYQRDDATLNGSQQRVLLRLAETMNLIYEKYRRSTIEETIALCLFNHFAHVFHTACHCTQRIERCLQFIGDNLCQSRFPHSRWSPQDKGRNAPCVYHLTQDSTRSDKMLLTNIFIERARTHSFS